MAFKRRTPKQEPQASAGAVEDGRYPEMNGVLDACIADVKARLATYKSNPPTGDSQLAARKSVV